MSEAARALSRPGTPVEQGGLVKPPDGKQPIPSPAQAVRGTESRYSGALSDKGTDTKKECKEMAPAAPVLRNSAVQEQFKNYAKQILALGVIDDNEKLRDLRSLNKHLSEVFDALPGEDPAECLGISGHKELYDDYILVGEHLIEARVKSYLPLLEAALKQLGDVEGVQRAEQDAEALAWLTPRRQFGSLAADVALRKAEPTRWVLQELQKIDIERLDLSAEHQGSLGEYMAIELRSVDNEALAKRVDYKTLKALIVAANATLA